MNTNFNKMKKCELIEYCKKLEVKYKKVMDNSKDKLIEENINFGECIFKMGLKITELEEDKKVTNCICNMDLKILNLFLHLKELEEENEELKQENEKLKNIK